MDVAQLHVSPDRCEIAEFFPRRGKPIARTRRKHCHPPQLEDRVCQPLLGAARPGK